MKPQFSFIGTIASLLVGLLVLSSCSPSEVEKPTSVLRENTITTVKAFGESFRSEIVKIDGQVVVWENRWGKHVLTLQKRFQNIFPIWTSEGESSVYNDFDKTQLDALFPLAVGKEVVFEGLQYRLEADEGAMFWAAISVVGTDTRKVQGEVYDVLIIDIITETIIENTISRRTTTLWHATELGLNLKTKYSHQLGVNAMPTVKFEVVKISFPDGYRDEERGVGTIRVHYEDADKDEENNMAVLNETQF